MKRNITLFLLMVCTLLFSSQAFAQEITVTGKVTGQTDEFTSVAATSNGEHTTKTTGRRSYPPMVFISILILLLLLIVRRIVMILQS
ncbi:MAG: hypothetical protein EOO89_30790 [Pedobacter sp.]|nr:MAG: hypothetical protein EOO89_30790 [Pedobacter sp.]